MMAGERFLAMKQLSNIEEIKTSKSFGLLIDGRSVLMMFDIDIEI